MRKFIPYIIIGIFILLVLKSCRSDESNDQYQGFYYPDIENMEIKKEFGPFDNLQECKDSVDDWRVTHIEYGVISDGECALNCTYRSEYGLDVCEKTFDA